MSTETFSSPPRTERSVAVELLERLERLDPVAGGSHLQPIRMIYHFDVSGILETRKFPAFVELLNY